MSKKDELHSTRVPLMMTQTELRNIEDWRRRQPDLPARAEAIRRLVQLGLTGKVAPPKDNVTPRTPSFTRKGRFAVP